MEIKDYITMITAIIGAVLGIVNLVMNIQTRLKEKITIYNDRLDLKYKLSGAEDYYEKNFIKVPLNINYCFHVLNNKNKTSVVEDSYIYTACKEMFDTEIFDSEYLEIAKLKNFPPISIESNSMKKIDISTSAAVYLDKKIFNVEDRHIYHLPFLSILSVKIDGKIYRKNINISIIIESTD